MADFEWPADLIPYKTMFYLQPHVGGSESPITRTRKVYGLSAPRWIARLTFRAGYDGAPRRGDQLGFGPRLDALIAQLEGGLNRVALYDFRRRRPLQGGAWGTNPTIDAAEAGATAVTVRGLYPSSMSFSVGDYIGGDGRPHLIVGGDIASGAGSIMVNAEGAATVRFLPPLSAPIAASTPLPRMPVTGMFRLVSEDAGQNEAEVGRPVEYVLDFVEDLG